MVNKIIKLDDKKDSIINFIKDLLEKAEKGKIDKLLIASNCTKESQTIWTGYYNLTFFEKQIYINTLSLDLNYQMIKVNIDDLIEIINE